MIKLNLLIVSILVIAAANAQLPNYVPTNGLIGFWPFTGNANDVSGNGHNGVVSGAVLDADRNGVANACYRFNGTSDIINVPSTGITNLNRTTLSAWVKYTGNANSSRSYDVYFEFGDYGNHTLAYSIDVVNNTFNFYHPCKPSLITNANLINNWHNVVVVEDSNITTTYLDGVFFNLQTNSTTFCYKGTNNLLFGASPVDLQWMTGSLDDIGFWNRSLSDQEVKNLFSGFPQSISSIDNTRISISPNPSKNILLINADNKNLEYSIINLFGETIIKGNLINENSINIENIASGNYFIRLKGEGINSNLKFTKI